MQSCYMCNCLLKWYKHSYMYVIKPNLYLIQICIVILGYYFFTDKKKVWCTMGIIPLSVMILPESNTVFTGCGIWLPGSKIRVRDHLLCRDKLPSTLLYDVRHTNPHSPTWEIQYLIKPESRQITSLIGWCLKSRRQHFSYTWHMSLYIIFLQKLKNKSI